MNLLNDSIRTKWNRIDSKLRPYWWAFAILFLLSLG